MKLKVLIVPKIRMVFLYKLHQSVRQRLRYGKTVAIGQLENRIHIQAAVDVHHHYCCGAGVIAAATCSGTISRCRGLRRPPQGGTGANDGRGAGDNREGGKDHLVSGSELEGSHGDVEAALPLAQAMPCWRPTRRLKASSNWLTNGPSDEIQPVLRHSINSSFSRSPITGSLTGMKSLMPVLRFCAVRGRHPRWTPRGKRHWAIPPLTIVRSRRTQPLNPIPEAKSDA